MQLSVLPYDEIDTTGGSKWKRKEKADQKAGLTETVGSFLLGYLEETLNF